MMKKKLDYCSNKKLTFILILLIIFVALVFLIRNDFVISINNSINQFITRIQIDFFILIFKGISNLLEASLVIVISLIFVVYLFLKEKKKESVIFLATVALSSALVAFLKNIFYTVRPVNSLVLEPDFAFPSAHSSIAVVLFGLFAYFYIKNHRKNKIPAVLISVLGVILVIFSRLCLNVHWFTDVIGGLIIGSIWLLIALYLLEFNFKK